MTPNRVLVPRVLIATLVAATGLLGLAGISWVVGDDAVLAIESANSFARAQRHDALGQFVGAASEFYRLIELRPDDTRARAALAELQLRRGLNPEALEQTQWLIEHGNPADRPRDLSLYGHVLAATGDEAGAADAYREALQLQPAYPDALYGLALCAATQGDVGVARDYFDRLKRAGTQNASREYMMDIRGGEDLERRLQEAPASPGFSQSQVKSLLTWYLKQGRLDDAQRLYQTSPHRGALDSSARPIASLRRIDRGGEA